MHGQPDLQQLRGVAVTAPDDDPGQPRELRLEHDEVAYAGLIVAAAVVDHEHASGGRVIDRLEDDIDAPEVRHRRRRPREDQPGQERTQ